MQRIGIMGGTFDPVHLAHLRVAMDVQADLQLDQVRFVPNRCPPHRADPAASIDQRLVMLETVLAEHESFVLDKREIERSGPSYMVDTLASLKADFDASICLILGTDAFYALRTWHQWEQLWDFAHIVVAHRPAAGDMPDDLAEIIAHRQVETVDELFKQSAGRFYFCPVTQLDISASRIRKMVANGKDIKYLTPEGVIRYIRKQNLYNAGK